MSQLVTLLPLASLNYHWAMVQGCYQQLVEAIKYFCIFLVCIVNVISVSTYINMYSAPCAYLP